MSPRPPSKTTLFASCAAFASVLAVSDQASALPIGGGVALPTSTAPTLPTQPIGPVKPSCPAPTLAQCQDPTYLDSMCGFWTKTDCGNLVAPIYQAQVRAISGTTQILASASGGPDTLQTAKLLTPIAQPDRKLSFGSLSFATAVQLGRMKPAFAATANLDPQHPDYEANGSVVASCQEYAYESLYDDERFVEAAETCGSNAECVYQLSLRTTTPGLKQTMLKKDGQPQSVQIVGTGPYSAIKNVYFVSRITELRQHPSYASDATFHAKVEAMIAQVAGTPNATAPSELAWHRSMHDVFAANPVSASELASIKQRTDAYAVAVDALGVADFAIPLLEAVIPGQSGDYQARSIALLNEYLAQKSRSLDDMARLAIAEWDHVSPADGVTLDRGCFSKTSVKCDWSPQMFVNRYAQHFRTVSENLFNACVGATGNNFARVPASYLATSDTLATWIEAQSLPKLASDKVGQRTADSDEWGDRSWFAAGYSYDAGWQLAADRQSGTNRICKLKGDAYAQATASAWALGNELDVFDTRHALNVRESGDAITFHSHLRVLGDDLYTPVDVSYTAPSATPIDNNYQKTLAERTYTQWISIAGVEVKLQAKAELKAGATVTAHATAASGCNPDNLAYDAGISVQPWIDVHVTPEVSVGIEIIQAGVRGDVDLLKVSVPASGSVKLVGGVNSITLQMRANTAVDIDALSGNISVFLESCFPFVGCTDLASKQIYSWDGYTWHIPVLGYSKDIAINVFDTATQTSFGGIGVIGGTVATTTAKIN